MRAGLAVGEAGEAGLHVIAFSGAGALSVLRLRAFERSRQAGG